MSNAIIKTLQENLKKFRKERAVSQLRLSILTGLSKDYITAIECGRRVPSVKSLISIAAALDIDVYKFFIKL